MYYFEQEMAVTSNPTSPTKFGEYAYFLWPECITSPVIFDDINHVKTKWQTAEVMEAGEMKVNPELRDHKLRVIPYDPATVGLFRELYDHVNSVNHWHFNFRLWSMEDLSVYQLNLGHKIGMHSDRAYMHDMSDRKLTMLVGLTQADEYDGGEVVISPHGNQALESSVKLNKGDVVIFPSWVPYEIKQVKKGTLEMLATWVYGPKFV